MLVCQNFQVLPEITKEFKMKKIALLFSLLFFALNVHAQSPKDLIRATTDAVIADIKVNLENYKKEPAKLYEFVETTVLKHFDFKRMTHLALGKYRRKMNAQQEVEMVNVFQELLVRTYSKALLEYEDQGVLYLSSKGSVARGEVIVRTVIDQPGGFPIPLNYKLYLSNNAWMVYDISVDNVSLVTNYRSSFSRQIKKSGIDGLIKSLRERNKSA